MYNEDKNLTFEELLEKDGSFTIHERNLQNLAIKMYKVKHNLCPKPFTELFAPAIRGNHEWILPKNNSVNKGIETIRYRGPKIWELVPKEIANSKTLSAFKEKKLKSGNQLAAIVDYVKHMSMA